jgi:DNA-binding response OmpR family regulator
MGQKILLIEDNSTFRKTVARLLTENGYDVAEAGTGKEGLSRAGKNKPDLLILDLVLPGISGLEVCGQFKQAAETSAIPILMLTGNDKDGQDIACLDMGADDYLTKPVKTERLLAHCRALLRRAGPDAPAGEPVVRVGGMSLDYGRKLVLLKGKEYPELTPKEFGLLYELARRSPEPQERAALYRSVWGMEPPSEGSLKTVDVHVRRIRIKLGWMNEEWLSYTNGRGYCLTRPG